MQRWDLMKLNFEGLEMQKWNIPTDRAQREERLGKEEKAWCEVTAHLLLHQGAWFWNVKNKWKIIFQHPEKYSEPCQTSKMERSLKIVKSF